VAEDCSSAGHWFATDPHGRPVPSVRALLSKVKIPAASRRRLGLRPSRRASGFTGGLAIFIGLVLLADAAVTVAWEDPFTAVFAQRDQAALAKRLTATEDAALPASTLELVRRAGSASERMAVLAGHMRATTRSGDALGRIWIPKTGKNFVFVLGTGVQTLKKGPGQYQGTPFPGERGTVAIAGHRTTYGAPFHNLSRLRRGYAITLTMPYGRFTYSVERMRSVPPTQTTVLRNVDRDRLVLTTCTPLGSADKRLVVTARLRQATPRGAAIELVPVAPKPPEWQVRGPRAAAT
jgi:sortase A